MDKGQTCLVLQNPISFFLPVPFKEGPSWVSNIRLNSGTKGFLSPQAHALGGAEFPDTANELGLQTQFTSDLWARAFCSHSDPI